MRATKGWTVFAGRGLLLILLLIVTVATPSKATTAAPPFPIQEVGPISAMALFDDGNGWAWAAPKPGTSEPNFLLRLTPFTTVLSAGTKERPELLPPGLQMVDMALTSEREDGWAIGNVGNQPVLWRFLKDTGGRADKDTWMSVEAPQLPQGFVFVDLTLSADGSDGWITARNQNALDNRILLRLTNHIWTIVYGRVGGALSRVAISPNGRNGWAVGIQYDTHEISTFYLDNGYWRELTTGGALPQVEPIGVTADDSANGWILSPATSSSQGLPTLTRLKHDQPLQPSPINAALPEPGAVLQMTAITGNADGNVWITGVYLNGDRLIKSELIRVFGETFDYPVRKGCAVLLSDSLGKYPYESYFPTVIAAPPYTGEPWVGVINEQDIGYSSYLFIQCITSTCQWACSYPPEAKEGDSDLQLSDSMRIESPNVLGRGPNSCTIYLRARFYDYYKANGGQAILGLPATLLIVEVLPDTKRRLAVQYTERARIEWHPEAKEEFKVQLGLLGNDAADERSNDGPFKRTGQVSGLRWFSETGHNLGSEFRHYYEVNGDVKVFGIPRSEAFDERNSADDKTYKVQYFERSRIEHHPEYAGTPYEFLLGLLGVEHFDAKYKDCKSGPHPPHRQALLLDGNVFKTILQDPSRTGCY